MGNTQPTNRTGRKATAQKLENARKLGVLSLCEHSLHDVPHQIYDDEVLVGKLRTFDLSKNQLTHVQRIETLLQLKTLNLDDNQLPAGSLDKLHYLTKLQNLSVSRNKLGKPIPSTTTTKTIIEPIGILPASIKQLNLSSNFLSYIPKSVISNSLKNLQKLDLSSNQLVIIPDEICNVSKLEELLLDSNKIVYLPETMGQLRDLKVLSLRHNEIQVSTKHTSVQQQPIPKSVFSNTSLIDLNLHGNRLLTNTQMNQMDGYQDFLNRRQKVKSKTMSDFDVCGLE